MLALRAIVAADGQQPLPSSREQASASASSTSRSLPEVGEFPHTQFITAMLIAAAPRMSGSGSEMGAASFRQVRSDAVYNADRPSLASDNRRPRPSDSYPCATCFGTKRPPVQVRPADQ